MFAKGKGSAVPSDGQAREKLALYVYEYLLHVGAQKSAQTFLSEIRWEKNITLGEPPGFLHSWWCVFWDLYCAAPERRDTCEHSSEAKAFHDYALPNHTLGDPCSLAQGEVICTHAGMLRRWRGLQDGLRWRSVKECSSCPEPRAWQHSPQRWDAGRPHPARFLSAFYVTAIRRRPQAPDQNGKPDGLWTAHSGVQKVAADGAKAHLGLQGFGYSREDGDKFGQEELKTQLFEQKKGSLDTSQMRKQKPPGGVPGTQPLLPNSMDPTRQQGHPNMGGSMQRMNPPRGMGPMGPGPQNYGSGMRPPPNSLGPAMPGINMGPGAGRPWPNPNSANSIPYSSSSPGTYVGPPGGGGPPGTPIMPSPADSTNSSDNIYTMINPVPPGGSRSNFPMGPGSDGPMGGMGGMEPHHMNGSLGSGDIDGLPKNSPNNISGISNPPGTPRDDGELGGNFLHSFQNDNYSPSMTMSV
ncbi:PREDICTED: single-stranded DNA-binding protein 3 isoform X3 [Cercocebus atys]|uniref:single-stranded DNA-binding protein 3 isoform X3 n=1 Tax=Cercocebus atys TaxID=9531 RepID=UPI0005F462C0|nr:PREDICTED: single-stranded DNA-binding protein 3 isoform X3 [Cercocebus atys]